MINATTLITSAMTMGLAIFGLSVSAMAQGGSGTDDQPNRTLSVSGLGEISAAPDVADVEVGVVTEAESAGEALQANNKQMADLQEVLKQRGVASRDIQTTNINLNPRYSQPQPNRRNQERRIIGYTVNNTVSVTARDLDNLGALLDAVVSAGANQLRNISFRIEETEKLMDECRKRAMDDAKRRAELLAGEAGLVLGPPVRINESSGRAPQPQPMARNMMAAAAESAVPVAPGEQDLSVSVQVVYELKLPESD